ncbi:murein biosynthesis integral membrane protein MurJ [Thermogemmatispora onikobensis]|uniref:murein biosynthesis integral membrane protein MurJ n=1 Tax=Thermogemmatispora onikobensis TaxID=732234 RepID=UPI0009FC512E|nr:lipid II flippase MurJ [Thermogemmatispora onikobensis]
MADYEAQHPTHADTAAEGSPAPEHPSGPLPLITVGAPAAEGELPLPVEGVEEKRETASAATAEPTAPSSPHGQVARGASLVMLGNLGSSIMGMVRQIVIAALGKSVAGPFLAASVSMQTFYDFVINGSVDKALIPTFSDYVAPEKRQEFRELVFTLVNVVTLLMLLIATGYALLAPFFVNFIAQGYTGAEKTLTLHYSQIIFFSLVGLGPFSVLLAALYTLREFGWPAFATAAFHIGIIIGVIVGALVGEQHFGQYGIACGVLLGAAGEILLLLPGIRRQKLGYLFTFQLRHPGIPRILKLYAPVAVSYFVLNVLLANFDLHLASLTPGDGAANVTALQNATRLLQFPIGLVASALAFSILPLLSVQANAGEEEQFKETLMAGIRLGLLVMIPAALGLIILRQPICDLIYRHGRYTQHDTILAATALQNYAYQLPFVAVDQLLMAAFFARKNTIVPVAVGFITILGYLAVALPGYSTIGMPALALANTVQNSSHALILLLIWRVQHGSLHLRTTLPALGKILLAAAVMSLVAWLLQIGLGHLPFFSEATTLGALLTVVIAGGVAAAVYLACILILRVEEIHLLTRAVMAKLGRK